MRFISYESIKHWFRDDTVSASFDILPKTSHFRVFSNGSIPWRTVIRINILRIDQNFSIFLASSFRCTSRITFDKIIFELLLYNGSLWQLNYFFTTTKYELRAYAAFPFSSYCHFRLINLSPVILYQTGKTEIHNYISVIFQNS